MLISTINLDIRALLPENKYQKQLDVSSEGLANAYYDPSSVTTQIIK